MFLNCFWWGLYSRVDMRWIFKETNNRIQDASQLSEIAGTAFLESIANFFENSNVLFEKYAIGFQFLRQDFNIIQYSLRKLVIWEINVGLYRFANKLKTFRSGSINQNTSNNRNTKTLSRLNKIFEDLICLLESYAPKSNSAVDKPVFIITIKV